MAEYRLLTIGKHVALTPALAEMLRNIAIGYESPRMKVTTDGIAIYLEDWRFRR